MLTSEPLKSCQFSDYDLSLLSGRLSAPNLPPKAKEEAAAHLQLIKEQKKHERRLLEKEAKDLRKRREEIEKDAKSWQSILSHSNPTSFHKIHSDTKSTVALWKKGLPPQVRATVWVMALGNPLGIDDTMYNVCVRKARRRQGEGEGKAEEAHSKSDDPYAQILGVSSSGAVPEDSTLLLSFSREAYRLKRRYSNTHILELVAAVEAEETYDGVKPGSSNTVTATDRPAGADIKASSTEVTATKGFNHDEHAEDRRKASGRPRIAVPMLKSRLGDDTVLALGTLSEDGVTLLEDVIGNGAEETYTQGGGGHYLSSSSAGAVASPRTHVKDNASAIAIDLHRTIITRANSMAQHPPEYTTLASGGCGGSRSIATVGAGLAASPPVGSSSVCREEQEGVSKPKTCFDSPSYRISSSTNNGGLGGASSTNHTAGPSYACNDGNARGGAMSGGDAYVYGYEPNVTPTRDTYRSSRPSQAGGEEGGTNQLSFTGRNQKSSCRSGGIDRSGAEIIHHGDTNLLTRRFVDGHDGSVRNGSTVQEGQDATTQSFAASSHAVRGVSGSSAENTTTSTTSSSSTNSSSAKDLLVLNMCKDEVLLRRISELLRTYVEYRPDIGYVQGMSYLAAMLLLHIEDDHKAFVALASLLSKGHLQYFYTVQHRGIGAHIAVFESVLEKGLPSLHRHFQLIGVAPQMYVIDWWMSLFSRTLSYEIASRCWDLFLLDEAYLYRISLALLVYFRNIIHDESPIDEVLMFLSKVQNYSIHEERFFGIVADSDKYPPSVAVINKIMKEHLSFLALD